jgi:thymidylate kinase
MKLLIIEGLDRTGKDTLVKEILDSYRTGFKVHWSFPKGETNEEKTEYQKRSFEDNFAFYADLSDIYHGDDSTILIWNRSHIGELVWGSLYRESKPETWVIDMEKFWCLNDDPDVYLVYLYADPEFIVREDDGNSYSGKLSDKIKELDSFEKAINASGIKKKIKIKVNEDDKYIDQKIITEQVNKFINDKLT